jgi:hypothetical protein
LIHEDRRTDRRTDGRTGGRTDGRLDGRTERQTDRQSYREKYMAQLKGHFRNTASTPKNENEIVKPEITKFGISNLICYEYKKYTLVQLKYCKNYVSMRSHTKGKIYCDTI